MVISVANCRIYVLRCPSMSGFGEHLICGFPFVTHCQIIEVDLRCQEFIVFYFIGCRGISYGLVLLI